MCTHYDEFVERITRCEHRTTKKGKRINDAANPLVMERALRWNEVVFDGDVRSLYHEFCNQNGIIIWGDGTMHDPRTKKTICPDGTIIEDDHWGGNMDMRRSFEITMESLKVKRK
jgi:hypothetical protein